MVRERGLEPPSFLGHSHLKAACLPISPLAHYSIAARHIISVRLLRMNEIESFTLQHLHYDIIC
jgi:hypothetical protein